MNDIYGLEPINGTAAIVTGQNGCADELTPKQERKNLIDHVNQLEAVLMLLPKKNKERKLLGLKKLKLCKEISMLNERMKKVKIDHTNRGEFSDCVFDVLREQLSPFKYKQIMRLSRELYIKLEKGSNNV